MTIQTCRFCKDYNLDDSDMVKYGVCHYAHFDCYLKAGKALTALHDWQIAKFPYRLIKEYKLEDVALAVAIRQRGSHEAQA